MLQSGRARPTRSGSGRRGGRRKCTFAVIKAQANSVIDRAAEASGAEASGTEASEAEASEAEASEAEASEAAGVGAAAVVGGCLLDWFVGWLVGQASKQVQFCCSCCNLALASW